MENLYVFKSIVTFVGKRMVYWALKIGKVLLLMRFNKMYAFPDFECVEFGIW